MLPEEKKKRDEVTRVLLYLGLDTEEEQILPDEPMSFEFLGKLMDGGMWTFRALMSEEAKSFRQSARDNYQPFTPIEGIWHIIYQMECVRINHEHSLYKLEEPPEDRGEGEEVILES